jgi:Spy/CpxP family protein refolding chaperone
MRAARVAVIGGCLVVLAASPAFAQAGRHGGSGAWGGPGLSTLVRAAGLTDAQQAQVKQIVANHRPQFQALIGQLRTAREALDAKLYGADPVSAADVEPALQQISQIRNQLAHESLQVALEVRSLLSPDQLAKAAQVKQRLTELQREMHTLLGGQ